MYIIVKKNYGFATYKTDISGQDDDATIMRLNGSITMMNKSR